MASHSPASTQNPQQQSNMVLPIDLLRTLIRANHILHQHDAVDAFGHISVRNPEKPDQYVISAFMAPALVSKAEHLVAYNISDSLPVEPDAPRGYAERFIHGEVLKRYSGMNCVIHSHAPAVLPFSVTGVDSEVSNIEAPQLKPVFHMAGFLGSEGAPVWDIEKAYQPDQDSDLLVKTTELGASLAKAFSKTPGLNQTQPDHTIVIMRHHGFTAVGPDIETTMYRTLYTIANAQAQLQATILDNASGVSRDNSTSDSLALQGKLAKDARAMNERTQSKSWPLWLREVGVNPLYQLEV